MRSSLSVFIIAFNEATRIARAIESVRNLSDDIVVIDAGSTDGTQDIAQSLGARFVYNSWPGYGQQKQFGEEKCRHAWRLNLDADEVVTRALHDEILELFKENPSPAAYSIRIVDVLPGQNKPSAFAYAHVYVRLYHRAIGKYSPSAVHDIVELKDRCVAGRLRNPIHHFSLQSLGSQLAKINGYTDALVQDLNCRGVRIPVWRIFTEFPFAFLKAYIGRRHCTRGVYGYVTAMNYAFFRHLRVAKYHEQRYKRANNKI